MSLIQPTAVAANPGAPPRLRVQNLSKSFGEFPALEAVNISLEPGTFHALLGENGAGKSTLVKCIMGFYQPSAGEIYISMNSPR